MQYTNDSGILQLNSCDGKSASLCLLFHVLIQRCNIKHHIKLTQLSSMTHGLRKTVIRDTI